MADPRAAYRRAGVDVAGGERAVELMRAHVESTRRPEVVGGLGGFGGAFSIPPGYREPLLIASTDGVGTKTAIASAVGRYDTIATRSIPIVSKRPTADAIAVFVPTPSVEATSSGSR